MNDKEAALCSNGARTVLLIASAKSQNAREASHKPTLMGSCLLVTHVSPVYLVDEKEGSVDDVIEGSEDAALV